MWNEEKNERPGHPCANTLKEHAHSRQMARFCPSETQITSPWFNRLVILAKVPHGVQHLTYPLPADQRLCHAFQTHPQAGQKGTSATEGKRLPQQPPRQWEMCPDNKPGTAQTTNQARQQIQMHFLGNHHSRPHTTAPASLVALTGNGNERWGEASESCMEPEPIYLWLTGVSLFSPENCANLTNTLTPASQYLCRHIQEWDMGGKCWQEPLLMWSPREFSCLTRTELHHLGAPPWFRSSSEIVNFLYFFLNQ